LSIGSRAKLSDTTGAPVCVMSAIVDALSVYGIRSIAMPATPYAVWKAIREAKQSPTSS
jgi:aerobic carbon-monoxide dehydrogenase large subunit